MMVSRRLQRSHPALVACAIAALVALAVLGARGLGWLERFELLAFDHFVVLSAARDPAAPRVAVVEVSEQDIQNLGSYPISDGDLARAIETLSESGARAIGLDIYRDIPVPPGTRALDRTLTGHSRVIVPSKFADADGHGVRPPKVLAGTPQVGFNNMVVDGDGSVRRGLLFMEDDEGGMGTSLSLRLAQLYLADAGIHPAPDPDAPEFLKLGASTFRPLVASFGGYADADTRGYQYLLDFRGAAHALPVVNLTELLAGEADPEIFRDRIVLLGVAAESLTDVFRIPFDPAVGARVGIPGVELHGQMADQIVRHARGETLPLRSPADWNEAVLVAICGAIGAVLMLWVRAGWGLVLLGFGGLFGLWTLGWLSLLRGYWVPVVAPAVAWTASLSLTTAYSRSRERAERAEIMQLFSRHVTKQVAENVWQHRDEFLEGGRPRPVRLTATILFIDIKGYTGNAEKMDPAELMEWIDGFLGAMAEEVLDRGGLVEDYFGDGMMACYGIPIPQSDADGIRTDANNAVVSALGMEQALRRLNAEWRAEGRPAVGIRVGICTGVVVAGSMGSADRLKYGVVGDAVVTAQRLESLGLDRIEHDFDEQPARILISEATNALLDATFRTERVGEFVIKGKNEPVTVYRVLGRAAAGAELRPDESEGEKTC